MTSTLTVSKWFKKSLKRSSDGESSLSSSSDGSYIGDKPLDHAIDWLNCEGSHQDGKFVPMILLSHEIINQYTHKGSGKRDYQVLEFTTFLNAYCHKKLPSHERLVHEVLIGPCKLYLDLEYDTASNESFDGEAMQSLILDACYKELQDRFTVIETRTVILDASSTKKFSRHITVHLDNEVFFENAYHVGAFIKHVLADHLEALLVTKSNGDVVTFYDGQVYYAKRTLRMYGSCKGDLSRPFVNMNQLNEHVQGPYNEQDFIDSLITQPVCNTAKLLAMPLHLLPSSRRRSPISSSGSNIIQRVQPKDALGKIVMSIPDIANSDPQLHAITSNSLSLYYTISCRSKKCKYSRREHTHNHIYFTLDLGNYRYRQKCHNDTCQVFANKSEWTSFPETACTLTKEYLSRDWKHGKSHGDVSSVWPSANV